MSFQFDNMVGHPINQQQQTQQSLFYFLLCDISSSKISAMGLLIILLWQEDTTQSDYILQCDEGVHQLIFTRLENNK